MPGSLCLVFACGCCSESEDSLNLLRIQHSNSLCEYVSFFFLELRVHHCAVHSVHNSLLLHLANRASFTCKTDSFSWGHGPDALACKARPSSDQCGTSHTPLAIEGSMCGWYFDARFLKERISTGPLSSCGIVFHIGANIFPGTACGDFLNHKRGRHYTQNMNVHANRNSLVNLSQRGRGSTKVSYCNCIHTVDAERDTVENTRKLSGPSHREAVPDKVINTLNSQELHTPP